MNAKAEVEQDQQVTGIAVYSEFFAQLAELRQLNKEVVFDYATPAGNKQARSHVYKLRQTKAAVDKARKAEKQASLDYGKRVDNKTKTIVSEIEQMIAIHQAPLDEIEQREKDRVAALQERLNELRNASITEGFNAAQIETVIDQVELMVIDTSYAEFTGEAATIKDETLRQLREKYKAQAQHEAEQAELARLRKEAEERAQKEREERIAREAAERAKAEAEAKAKREAEAIAQAQAAEKAEAERKTREAQAEADRKELELKLRAEQAQREKEVAERRAEQAEAKAKAEAAAEKAREAAALAAREADTKHRKAVNNAALDALIEHAGLSQSAAKRSIEAIVKGLVPNVKINY